MSDSNTPARYGPLATTSWWAQVVEGAVRQNLQILLPFLALVGASGRLDGKAALAVVVAFVVATATVVLLRVAQVAPGPDVAWPVQFAYRAVSAVAASIGAALAAEGFDLLTADIGAILVAALASGVTAVVHGIADPPASVTRSEVIRSVDLGANRA